MCEPGATEAWFNEGKTSEIASWVSQEDLETHGKILQSGGLTGPLNWYKQAMAGITHASEARISPDYATTNFTTPTLYIGCANDPVCLPDVQVAGMKDNFSDFTVKMLNTGHWCMIEKPEELWELTHNWIEENI